MHRHPPPPVVTQTPTQAVATQTALNEVSGKQTRLNMELGAQLDRTNAEFFAGQDIRRGAAASAEDRLTRQTQAGLDTGLARVRGQEERAGIVETGTQYREGLRLQEPKRGQQEESRAKSNVLELGKPAPKRGRQGELRAKNSVLESEKPVAKLEQLTCNERCSGAIKRTGISNRLSANIEHD